MVQDTVREEADGLHTETLEALAQAAASVAGPTVGLSWDAMLGRGQTLNTIKIEFLWDCEEGHQHKEALIKNRRFIKETK